MLENGSYEFRVFQAVPEAGITLADLKKTFSQADIGINKAMAYKWIKTEKGADSKVTKIVSEF